MAPASTTGRQPLRRIHLPFLLGTLAQSRQGGFVALFTLEAICRALALTVIPLRAYNLLQDAQLVSLIYVAVTVLGLAVSLAGPMLMHIVRRRWMMSLGALLYVAAAMLFALGTVWSVVAGLAVQTVATTVLEVTINLYVLDHVPRKLLGNFEPRRMLYSGIAFIAGPWLGVYLNQSVRENLTFALVGLTALGFLAVFWLLRLTDNPAVAAMVKPPPRPTRYLVRFARQPRLLLAWVLAIGRNGWWVMFFIYAPIYVTEAGYSEQAGGALVSLGVLPMVLVRYWGRVGERIGIRRLLMWGYATEGGITIAAGLVADLPAAAMVFLWGAAFMGTIIDAAGNVTFLRAVHPHERAEMTAVFATYRHGATLGMPALFAAILTVAPLSCVFVGGGIVSLAMAWLARYLPKRF